MQNIFSRSLPLKHISFLVLLALFLFPRPMGADDPGISKVRLIQTSEKSYYFETDITAALLWTLKDPIFPDRFKASEPIVQNVSGWVTIRIDFSTTGDPLSPKDEIILPWTRNAVDVTAQWLEGDTYKGLYYRQLRGIHIPIEELMPIDKSTKEVLEENFELGLSHLPFKGIHIFFILALVLLTPNRRVFQTLLYLSTGQMLAMLTAGLDLSFASLIFGDLLLVLLTLVMAYCLVRNLVFEKIGIALLVVGFIHSTAYLNESVLVQALDEIQKTQGLFAFNLSMDIGHYLLAAIGLGLNRLAVVRRIKKKQASIVIGSISVFMFLLIGSEHILAGDNEILKTDQNSSITYIASGGAGSQNTTPRGSAAMTTPIMVFLSVEPYEVRQEVLVMGRAANKLLQFSDANEDIIPAGKQEKIKQAMLDLLKTNDSVSIDGKPQSPLEASVNFVSLGPGGVSIRETPVDEHIDEALIGISFLYDIEGYPDAVQSSWNVFPDDVEYIEYQAVDLHATSSRVMTLSDNRFNWESKLKGFEVKAIEPIEAEPTPVPIVSYMIWAILGLALIFVIATHKTTISRPALILMLLVGFVCYPFFRVQLDLPIISWGKPSVEKTESLLGELLSNVYRAFDRRNEDAVYDRLALSVTDNQLSEIYLQNRQAMALENRGGARAKVDEVIVQSINDVRRNEGDGYIAEAEWTVRGSVNHFGHTHYRQNQYRSLVSFLIEDGVWKISKFEILDTERLY